MSGHVVSRKTTLAVAAALMILLGLTFGVSHLDLGPFNLVATLVIAFVKMMLVVLFFMELRWSDRLTWIVAGSGLFWLLILIGLTLSDTLTRAVIAGP